MRTRDRTRPLADYRGQVYGALRALRYSHQKGRNRYWVYECLLCGEEVIHPVAQVTNGHIRWHSCVRWEFDRWNGARKRTRCEHNPVIKKNYKDKGIVMEPEFDDFLVFLAEVGPLPSQRHDIDRIDCKGNYCPGNVRWCTKDDPTADSSGRRMVELDGRTQTLKGWCFELGLSYTAIINRIHEGQDEIEALHAPVRDYLSEFGMITYDGKTLTAKQWSKLCGFGSHITILERLRKKWNVQEALTIPSSKNRLSGYKPSVIR